MIFILGIERSATTWVANILDHHPKTEVYMEPLSSFDSRFKEWPDRFKKFKNNIDARAAYFQEEFEILKKHRHLLITRLSDSALAWKTDLKLADFLVRKQLSTNATEDFLQLNFHRKGHRFSVTKKPPLRTVIKELRLNFKVELLPHIVDQPQVLVIIRDMASCVRSILNQMEQGNLVELKHEILDQYAKISVQTIGKYWFESYSILLDSLQSFNISHKIISHTQLLRHTQKRTSELLTFLNLSGNSAIDRYLKISDQLGRGKHNTERNSEVLLERIAKDREQLYPNLGPQVENMKAHPVLRKFV